MVLIDDDVTKEDNESKVFVFGGAQTHVIKKVEDPKLIWDSGSTIVLAKREIHD